MAKKKQGSIPLEVRFSSSREWSLYLADSLKLYQVGDTQPLSGTEFTVKADEGTFIVPVDGTTLKANNKIKTYFTRYHNILKPLTDEDAKEPSTGPGSGKKRAPRKKP